MTLLKRKTEHTKKTAPKSRKDVRNRVLVGKSLEIQDIFEKAMEVEYKDATAIACEDNYYHSMEKKEGTVNE